MTSVRKLFFFLPAVFIGALFTHSPTSFASDYVQTLQQQAIALSLHQDPYWLALGHYYDEGDGESFKSYTDDAKFFLSSGGWGEPKQELLATLEGFFDETVEAKDHAQCRFPARFNWLSSKLNIEIGQLPSVSCEQYRAWRKTVKADSVTLIFASHYVNSPSSMYGHTLLRIDPKKGPSSSDWLSYAVNFGANIIGDDNSVQYAWRGLTGGYPGYFSIEPYYKKIKVYSNMENRGLWEYKLNLSVEEVERLVTHLWELSDINFDYFFISENCSFRLLELLEIARPDIDLLSEFTIKAIPTDTVRTVKDKRLVASAYYRQANIEKLKAAIASLSDEQQALAFDIANDTSVLDQPRYSDSEAEYKPRILYVAYQYLRHLQRKTTRKKIMADRSHRLLLEISQLKQSYKPPRQQPVDPIDGHETMLLAAGVGSEGDEDYFEAQWRISYHDLLDPSRGYPIGLGIEMLGVTARQWRGGRSTLERIDLVGIDALTVRDRFFSGFSWRMQGGFERVYNEQGNEFVPHFDAGGGVSYALGENIYSYGLLTARYEYNESFRDNHQLAAGFSWGVLSTSESVNASLEASVYEFANGVDRSELVLKINMALAKNHSVRLELEHGKEASYQENNIKLSYRLFY